jgi:hypothetical protein
MDTQVVLSNLTWGMEVLPFPALLLYAIGAGMLWLLLEGWLTRTARATPGWRKPLPVLPLVSEAATWLVRGSSWLLWIWAAFYLALVALHWAVAQGESSNLAGTYSAMLGLAGAWQQGYNSLVGILPQVVAQVLPGV